MALSKKQKRILSKTKNRMNNVGSHLSRGLGGLVAGTVGGVALSHLLGTDTETGRKLSNYGGILGGALGATRKSKLSGTGRGAIIGALLGGIAAREGMFGGRTNNLAVFLSKKGRLPVSRSELDSVKKIIAKRKIENHIVGALVGTGLGAQLGHSTSEAARYLRSKLNGPGKGLGRTSRDRKIRDEQRAARRAENRKYRV